MRVSIRDTAGDFAEDKDLAASIREHTIQPQVKSKNRVTLDFTGVSLVTQSFIHALIADVLRQNGEASLKYIVFKGCSSGVRGIIETVVQYALETSSDEETEPSSGAT